MPSVQGRATTTSKKTPKVPINPRLFEALDGNMPTDKPFPSVRLSDLPSEYATLVHRKRDQVPKDYRDNQHWLTCQECGKRGKYDLGLIAVHPEQYQKRNGPSFNAANEEALDNWESNVVEHIQCTGYFRCKHCNAAGNWAFPKDFMMFLLASMLRTNYEESFEESIVQLGHFQTFDGSEPKWATDAEEHLLDLIHETPNDAFLWNRLGNVYNRGGVPELAVVAFEESLRCDAGQVESHVLLANILYHLDEFDACIHHSHLALVHARYYKKLNAQALHDMLCVLLRNLLDVTMVTGNTDLFLPPMELAQSVAEEHGKHASSSERVLDIRSFDFYLDDIQSFSGLANIYLGKQVRSPGAGTFRRHRTKKKKRR
ncbi:hypothetical protein [Alicyclobacillus dauci]|uniref:Tetratricopeptide repeat-containing protein n=1 Tax=Alicyclobacillus dauci TaxID=1475485 RepID=A0ABY6Z398_9BACL|nr:hypothetical protein [Alicyclobacillus dauci]WAH36801.1 hypothetical protein NZD86_21950 [Alicyclobacillus dauci]